MAISGLQGPLLVHLISVHPISSVSLNLLLGFVWLKLYTQTPIPTERKNSSFPPKKVMGFQH